MRGGVFIQKTGDGDYPALNCNKLKIITQYISFLSLYYGGGGLLERGLISFFHSKRGGGLFERGAYLRGGLNREITVFKLKTFSDFKIFIEIRAFG